MEKSERLTKQHEKCLCFENGLDYILMFYPLSMTNKRSFHSTTFLLRWLLVDFIISALQTCSTHIKF